MHFGQGGWLAVRKVDGGNPALGLLHQGGSIRLAECDAIVLLKECLDLFGQKGQFLESQPADLVAGDKQRRIRQIGQAAGGQDQMHLFIGQRKKASDHMPGERLVADQMKVVQDQQEMFVDLGIDFIGDGNEQPFFVPLG
jgi:hypothetical protein